MHVRVGFGGSAEDVALGVVADGMGGCNAGDVASQMAVDLIVAEMGGWLARAAARGPGWADQVGGDVPEALAKAFWAANRQVHASGAADAAKSGMGTTVTAALVIGDRLILAHVGDSRGFVVRDGRIEQVTTDHSVVAEMMRNGQLTAAEAAAHPHRNVLTRALGTDARLVVDLYRQQLRPGDAVILCSDGVTRHVADDELTVQIDAAGGEPAAAARKIVDLALNRGGTDNATVAVITYLGCCDR